MQLAVLLQPSHICATVPGMSYPGTKGGSGVWQWIINQIPSHRSYIEPFAGRFTVGLKFQHPPRSRIGIEVDPVTVAETRQLIDEDYPAAVVTNPHTATFSEHYRRRFGRLPKASLKPRIVQGCGIDYLEAASQNAATLQETLDAGSCDARAECVDVFMLIDPPYPRSCRRSQDPLYRHELSDSDHRRIIKAILRLSTCPVSVAIMVCSYANPMYDDCLSGWRTSEFATVTRSGKPAVEKVWMSYPEPSRLQDYSFLGANKRERERLNRIRRNEVAKIRRKPLHERNAFFQMLVAEFGDEVFLA